MIAIVNDGTKAYSHDTYAHLHVIYIFSSFVQVLFYFAFYSMEAAFRLGGIARRSQRSECYVGVIVGVAFITRAQFI